MRRQRLGSSVRVVAGADTDRGGGQHPPAGLGMALMVVNQNEYAAATITVEAQQPVISTGLYGIVRYPMYAFASLMIVGMPLALDSYWGLVTVAPAVAVLAYRITDEEKALRAGLAGYDEYTEKVRYRLVPYVW
jgi:protein-S-isoprenylcysteine O-methyltransferase Ste14